MFTNPWDLADHRAVTRSLDGLLQRGATPGLQYVVVTPDEIAFEYAGGWAALDTSRAMTADTTLMAYSMTKSITAIAVLQLVDAGLVSLDAPLGDWSPYGGAITARQLLTHTAGIPAPLPLRWVHPAASHATFDEPAALARVLRSHHRAASPPGQRFRYSNIGYWLLGQLVERVTGTSFRDYVATHVINRLGISSDELGFEVRHPERHAAGYLERFSLLNLLSGVLIDPALMGPNTGRWVQVREHYVDGAAVGGLVGTARAFGRLLQDQLAPHSQLLSDDARCTMMQVHRLPNGREIPMTPGWHVRPLDEPVLFKEGGGGGFHCMMRLYPHAGIGTVLMTNATGVDVARAMDVVDAAFVSGAGRVPLGAGR